MNYEIKSEFLKVTVASLGAELISAIGADGFEYMWNNDNKDFWSGHAPVLFPACGRTLNNTYTYKGISYEMKSHGFAPKTEFTLVKKEEGYLKLSLKSNEETKKNYPFDFELIAEYKIEKSSLIVNFTVHNTGDEELPYMFGWHPAFALDSKGGSEIGDWSLDFDGNTSLIWHPLQNGCFVNPNGVKYELEPGKYFLNEKEIYDNNTMIFVGTGGHATLSCDNELHGLALSYSENLPYFCIWKEPSALARFICLEPWSDVPSNGEEPEIYETKKLSRLPIGKSEEYNYKVDFFVK